MTISNFCELLRKKTDIVTDTVATAATVSFFFCFSAFCYFEQFFSIFGNERIPRFHGFIVKMMTSWSLWVCQRNYRQLLTEAIEYQKHLNSHSEIVGFIGFYMLLKMVILVKRENIIKANQSYEYIVSLIFKGKLQVPITLLLYWITEGCPSRVTPCFLSKKYIASSNIRNCMLKRDM